MRSNFLTHGMIKRGALFLVLVLLALSSGVNAVTANTLKDNLRSMQNDTSRQKRQQREEDKEKPAEGPTVIEIYTGIDCNLCIFADRMLYDAIKDPKVIALSCLIEDFSDMKYVGRSRKDHTSEIEKNETKSLSPILDPCVFRLWTYERNIRDKEIVMGIPTAYFNGQESLSTSDLNRFESTTRQYRNFYKNKALDVFMRWEDEDTLSILLPVKENNNVRDRINASVYLVRYNDMKVVKVDEGVNKGKVLRFSNIMQSITHVGKWHGQERVITLDVPKPKGGKEKGGYITIVQSMLGEPILAAGKLPDYPLKGAAPLAAPADPAPPENTKPATPSE